MKALLLFILVLTQKTLLSQKIVVFENDSISLEESDTIIEEIGDKKNCTLEISGSTYFQKFKIKNGFIESKITYSKDRKLICEVYFSEGQKKIRLISYSKSGYIDEIGYYKNGLKDSVWTFFYATGEKQLEAKFKASLGENTENIGQGIYRFSIETGMEEIIECRDDKNAYPDGEWLYYDRKGNIINRLKFKKGILTYYQVNE